jgi:uncharacterized membrane protein
MAQIMKTHWLKIALGVSLTLNLLVLGFMVGQWRDGGVHARHDRAKWADGAHKVMNPEVRATIMALMQQNKSQIMAARDAYRKSNEHVARLLQEPEVDLNRLSAALNESRGRLTDMQAVLHTMLTQAVPSLTVEERLALVRKQGKLLKKAEGVGKKRCKEWEEQAPAPFTNQPAAEPAAQPAPEAQE